jgi:phosphoglycerate dehydrogenase-like enzyme
MKIAVLDDYLGIAAGLADWTSLGPGVEMVPFREPIRDADTLAAALQPFDVICLMRERTPLGAAVIDRLDRLRLIVTAGRRNAALDLAAAHARDITVCGTPNSGRGTVELTWALILALYHRVDTHIAAMRAGLWQTALGDVLAGSRLGIVGLGRIGTRVARVAQAFDMDIVAWSPNLDAARAAEAGARRVEKDELFATADAVTLHLALSDRSRGVVDSAALRQMKPSAYLVNTARAGLMDMDALAAALEQGRIAGAAIDVFDEEPLPADHPLRRCPRLLMTPHVGYVSTETLRLFYGEMVRAIAAWMAGEPIRVITPEAPELRL